MVKNIYVTGAAGMIGSAFSRHAVQNNMSVIGIDDFSRGKKENIVDLLARQNFKFICADISHDSTWSKDMTSEDVIVHLADVVGGIGYVQNYEWKIFNQNIKINSKLAEIVNTQKPRQLIYVGTACSYPKDMQRTTDMSGLVEDDKFPADPESGYGWSKLIGDIEYSLLCKSLKTVYTNLDLHNVYGSPCDYSLDTAQVIPSLIHKALTLDKLVVWGDGMQGRAFVEVRDVVAAIDAAIVKCIPGSYMIGPNCCTSIKDLVDIIMVMPGIKSKLVEYDLSKPVGDIGRYCSSLLAENILGWSPKISLEQGLLELSDYIAKNISAKSNNN